MARDRDDPGFRWVVIVPVTSANPNDFPTIRHNKLDRIPDLHPRLFVPIPEPQSLRWTRTPPKALILLQWAGVAHRTFQYQTARHRGDGIADRLGLLNLKIGTSGPLSHHRGLRESGCKKEIPEEQIK
jgi:hypothetical protein